MTVAALRLTEGFCPIDGHPELIKFNGRGQKTHCPDCRADWSIVEHGDPFRELPGSSPCGVLCEVWLYIPLLSIRATMRQMINWHMMTDAPAAQAILPRVVEQSWRKLIKAVGAEIEKPSNVTLP